MQTSTYAQVTKNVSAQKWAGFFMTAMAVLSMFFTVSVKAQSAANYAFATNTSGSLVLDANSNAIDLTSGQTNLVTATSSDQSASSVTSIGFDFWLGGNRYSQFSVSTNGLVQLGSSTVSTSSYVVGDGSTTSPKISAYAADLGTGTTGSIKSKVVGTAPNRCLVIEFNNMTLLWTSSYTNDGTYQVRLYENGTIEFVYGTMSITSTANAGDKTPAVGFAWGAAANAFSYITTSANSSTSTGTFTDNPIPSNGAIANLNSAANGSRRVYSFTPTAPNAPAALNFTAVTGNSMTLNWTDNSGDEIGFAIYRSIDNINFTYLSTTAANAVSSPQSGLAFGTTYYWKVAAIREIPSAVTSASQATNAGSFTGGATPGIVTVGTGGDFNNLTTAFAAINAAGLANNIDIQLITGYPAVAETYPIISSTGAAAGSFTIHLYPTVSGLSVTSANTTGTLRLEAAGNLTIDGRVGGTGSANDLVISNTNAGTSYAVLFINEASNNTIRNCNVQSRNTSTTSGTIVFSTTTGAGGNDNNTITLCNISEITSNPLNGIYASGSTTTTAQYNDNNTISNNNIFNFFATGSATNGILVSGGNSGWNITGNSFYQTAGRTYTTGATHAAINIASTTAGVNFIVSNNFIGGTAPNAGGTAYTMLGTVANLFRGIIIGTAASASSSVTGNTITNIAFTTSSASTTLPGVFSGIHVTAGLVNVGVGTGNTIGATTGNGAITITSTGSGSITTGIYGTSAAALTIQNNNIGSISTNSAAGIGHVIQGINIAGAGNHVVSLNNIGSATAANSISSGTNGTTTAACELYGILAPATSTTLIISSNSIRNLSVFTTGAGTMAGIYSSATVTNLTMNSNTISDIKSASASGTIYGLRGSTSIYIMNSNSISNLSFPANSGTSSSNIYGIYDLSSPTSETLTSNQLFGFSIAGATTSTGSVMAGLYTNSTTGTKSWSLNTIRDFTFTNSSTGSVTMYGIFTALSSPNIFKNKVYGLTATNGTASVVYGIYVSTGTAVTVYNNLVGNLAAPASSLTAPAPSLVGLYIAGGTTINAYYNTVTLNGSGGTNFGTAAVYSTSTPTTVNLRNNIFNNLSTPSGAGKTVAYQRSNSTLTNYAATSNNNLFYAGTPSATNLVYFDGTNTDQTLGAFKARMITRDQNAVTENPPFLSTTGSSSDFLHINPATPTLIESGAQSIATFTEDYDADSRNATTPDIGADEFAGTAPVTVLINSVNITPSGNFCTATSRTVTANITAGQTDIVSVTLNYSFNGAAPVPVTMTGGTLTAGSTSDWTGNIPVSTPANAIVTWSVTAVDGITTKISTGTAYQDEPLLAATATINAVPATLCSGSPSTITATINGLSTAYCTPTIPNTTSPGATGDYLKDFTFADITNNGTNDAPTDYTYYSGLTAHVVANGTTAYNVSLGAGGASSLYAQQFRIWIDFNHNGSFEASESVFNTTTATYIGSGAPATGTATIPTTAYNGITRMRVASKYSSIVPDNFSCGYTSSDYGEFEDYNVSITGGVADPFVLNYSWSDAGGVVGTGNPLIVSPASTNTYTLTISIPNGCTKSFTPVTVTTTPLPAAPGGNNSTQCGVGVPGAFVTSGGAGAGFKWYDAQTGGNLLQTGGATYAGSISSTTHFWVSESDGTCESLRTEVVASVNPPDAVSASSDGPVCANTALQLTATVTGNTNGNNYTYTWTAAPAAGSGIPVSQNGGSGTFGSPAGTTVTPTTPGTYTYTVTGIDGDCTANATVIVTVKTLPFIASANGTPSTICEGVDVTLAATSAGIGNGPVAIGTGAGTTGQAVGNPFYHLWGGQKTQFIYTKAELNAAGLGAGNITALSFQLTALGSSTLTMGNFTISVGHTTQAAGTSTLITSGLTTVYSNATQPVSVGTNNYSFANPFNWNNTDNIVVSICWSNVNSGTNSATPTIVSDVAPFTSTSYIYADNATAAAIFAASVNTGLGTLNTSGTSTTRPRVVFTGVTATNNTASFNWSWNPGALSGSTVTVNPVSTTTYTVTVTDPVSTCSNTATVIINVNPLPALPSANNGTDQCGTGLSDMSVSSNNTVDPQSPPFFNWYDAATGGVLKQSGTSTTYTTPIISSTTLYVSEVSANGCEGPRQEITTNVVDPDQITVGATSTTVCVGTATDISAAYTPNFNLFSQYTLTASPEAGSGITNPVTINSNATGDGSEPYTVTPTVAGTYTYTIIATDPDKGCTTSQTVTITVNGLPVVSAAIATPATICEGASSTLTAESIVGGPGSSATIGSNTGFTTATTQPTAFCNRFDQYWAQTVYTAAQLTAAGLTAGPITAITYNTSTQGDANNNPNFSIRIGTTAGTTVTAFVTTGLNLVYGPSNYVHAIGLNTITFDAPFMWDGTSNILIDVRHDGVDATNNARTQFTTAAGNVTVYAISSTPSSTTPLQTLVSNGTATPTLSTSRLDIKLAGIVGTNLTNTYTWEWNPGAIAGNPVTVTPSTTTTYTVTATNPATTCTGTATTTVTVNALPNAPVGTDSQQCGLAVPAAAVTSGGGGGNGTFNWYDVASGGTPLQSGTSLTYTTAISATTTFYVSENGTNGCEGPRTAVTVTVVEPPVISTSGSTTSVCQNGTVTLNATSTESNYVYTWTASPAANSGITGSLPGSAPGTSTNTVTPTAGGIYIYTVTGTETVNNCTATATAVVSVNANPVITTAVASKPLICNGQASVLSATSNLGGNINAAIGAGTTTNTGGPNPYYRLYEGSHKQYLVPVAELNAGGLTAARSITSLTFTVSGSVSTPVNFENFIIRLGNTSSTSLTAFDPASLTTVLGPISYSPVTGANLHTFTVPFAWDGTSNIVVDVAFDNDPDNTCDDGSPVCWGNTPTIVGTTTAFTATVAYYEDNEDGSRDMSSITDVSTTSTFRPNMILGSVMDVTNSLNWVWNPGGLTGSSVSVTPAVTTTYTVVATNPATTCVSEPSTVTITVAPVGATATATPSTPVCAGTAVSLNAGATGAGPFSYSWNDGVSVFSTAATPPPVTPAVTTTYTVTVTDACGASTTSSVTVTVNPLPAVAVTPATASYCSPGATPVALSASGATTYTWLPVAGLSAATGANVNATPTVTTTYTVTGTDGNGCVKTATTVITVNPNIQNPVASASPATVCTGSPISLTSSASLNGAVNGYSMNSNSAVAFIDISTTGTSIGTLSDDSEHNIAVPSFTFNGTTYTTARVGTNGLIVFGSTTGEVAAANAALPSTANSAGNSFLAPYWDDLDIQTSAKIYTQTVGNQFIVQFNTMAHNDFTTGSITFEVQMNLSNGVISYVYPDVIFGNATQDAGKLATIGLQRTSALAVQYSFNTASLTNGQSITFTPTYAPLPINYSWTGPDGFTSLVQNPTATATSTGAYTVTFTSAAGCSGTATTQVVTVNTRPTGTISGSGTYCEGQNTATSLTLTFTGTGPWNYTYTDGTTPVSGTTATSPVTVTVTPTTTGVTTYTLSALSDAGCASIAADLSGSGVVTVNPSAANPTATVTQPTCSLATGSITMTAPLGTGNSYTLDGTTTITWPTVTFSGVAPGAHTITVANSFGCSAPASASVMVDPQPFTPTTPVITGLVNVCPYLGTGEQQTYTAATTGNGNMLYTWTLPPNVTLVSGGGTNSTNNFVTVTFGTGLSNPAQANRQIRVTAKNDCGTSGIGVFYLLTQAPVTPNPIAGPTNVCALIGTPTTATYTINSVLAATGYSWSVPSNATFTSVNGPGVNDTSIVVTFPAGFTGGVVSVAATNGCGSNAVRTLTIVNAPPSTPALISGSTNVCSNIAPGGTAATYSVAPVAFATSYTWTAPAGAVVTHPNGAGPNDNTITVLYPAGFTNGTITVTATNGCGTSGVRSLSVTKLNPGTPSVIDVIQTHFCGEVGGRKYTYTLASMPANATSVLWTIPAGATYINLSAISIEVTYPDGAVNGTVTAQGVNNCGISSVRSTAVKLPACPTEFAGNTGNNGTGTVKGNTSLPAAPVAKAMEVKIFPNPSVSDFKMEVLTSKSGEINVRVMDNLGRSYKTFRIMPNQTIALGAELKAGSYFIEVRQGTEVKTTKVIKF